VGVSTAYRYRPDGACGQRKGGGRLIASPSAGRARKLLGWPKRCKLARAFLWEYSDKKLRLPNFWTNLVWPDSC
jgi:hypothetical protein